MAGGRDGGAPVIMKEKESEKPKGLLDGISELQYLYTQECNGMDLPEGLFTTKDQVVYFELGFRSTFASGISMALLTPLSMGVLEKMIPVFGSTNPSPFDTFYVLLLTLFYLIGYGVFLGVGVRSFRGGYTHAMVKNLMMGIAMAAVLKVVIIFLLFHFIYIKLLTEDHVLTLVSYMTKYFTVEQLAGPYKWLMAFRPVFLTSSWFVVITTGTWLAVLGACYLSARYRNRKLRDAE